MVRTGAIATAGIFLLAGCGGGGGGDSSNKIKGADGASHSATPSPSASSSGVKRPEITLPSSAKNVFEGEHTGDPKKDSVLADNARMVNSLDDAIFRGKEFTSAIGLYNTGPALRSATDYVKDWVKDRDTWVGTTRYYDRKVTFLKDGSAAVTYCGDESKAFTKSGKTGKVDRSLPSDPSVGYVLYNSRLVKSHAGVWQTIGFASKSGAEQCQP